MSTPVQVTHVVASLITLFLTTIGLILFGSNYYGIRIIQFFKLCKDNRNRNNILAPEQIQLLNLQIQWLQQHQQNNQIRPIPQAIELA